MKKKIAIVIRDRQEEAFRMSLGLTILDDDIDIFVLDSKLAETENTEMNLEMIKELGLKIYTNSPENAGMAFIANDQLADTLLSYDHVLPY